MVMWMDMIYPQTIRPRVFDIFPPFQMYHDLRDSASLCVLEMQLLKFVHCGKASKILAGGMR